jgi:dTDP-4-amino-4,6-dideoxyglucose formyltransferase
MYKKILILVDNEKLFLETKKIFDEKSKKVRFEKIDFRCSPDTPFSKKYSQKIISEMSINRSFKKIIRDYDLVFSIHCKQIFPRNLVESIPCINIHPGYNPFNRGWYPHIFSMLNGLPAGVTIHRMDSQIDHGAIIDQENIKIKSVDTSKSLYNKILKAEIKLFKKNFDCIITNNFAHTQPVCEGNINYKYDFHELQEIKMEKTDTLKNFITYLRAMSHPPYYNCFFFDENGKKIFVQIALSEER